MKFTYKRFISLLMSGFMVLTLAACGGGDGPDKDDDDVKEGMMAAVGSKYAEGYLLPELQNTEIRWLLSSSYEYHQNFDSEETPDSNYQAFKTWEETYGTKVIVDTVAWDDFTVYLTTGAASGDMPDIVNGGTTWFPSWPASGLVQPIDDYIDFSADDKWNLDIMNQLKWKGRYYIAYCGMPEVFYICFNKTKFDLAGEKTPLEHWQDGNWNWTQFIKTAKSMTNVSNNEYGYTGWNLSINKAPYSLINVAEDGTLTSNLKDPRVKNYFQGLYEFFHSGAKRTDNSSSNYMTTFFAGQDAMIHISAAEYVRKQKMLQITGGDEFRIAPTPIIDSNKETVSRMGSNVYGLSISSQAKNPKGAAVMIDLVNEIDGNIQKSYGELGTFGTYLSEEEKAAVKEANKTTPEINMILGVPNGVALWNENGGDFIVSDSKEGSVSSFLDSFDSVLNAELREIQNATK